MTTSPGRLNASTARALATAALTLGVIADSLFRSGPDGLGVSIWFTLCAINLAAIAWRDGRSLPRESSLWLGTGVAFAVAVAWRDSMALTPFDVLAVIACFGMAVIRLRDRRAALFAAHFRETLAAAVRVGRDVLAGAPSLAFREVIRRDDRGELRGRLRPIVRATLLGGAVLVVFGSLLRAADPMFASFVALPAVNLGDVVGHVLVIGFFGCVVAGWARSGLLAEPEHRVGSYGFSLRLLDVTTVLATLDVLFALFVVAQLGWIFGGEAFLRARTGLTAAAYARQGFFQMVWVVALVIPVLVVSRGALANGPELKRRHTLLALPAIGLLGAMIGSAVLRMKMYVHFYGLTTDRFYTLVLMAWLAFVLVWLAATVLRGRERIFAAGALGCGLTILAALNAADPDLVIARVNMTRAMRLGATPTAGQAPLDIAHLATLQGGAVEIATQAVAAGTPAATVADRCEAARHLLRRWGPESSLRRRAEQGAAWRYWNADDARALRVVGAQTGALQTLVRHTCPPPAAPTSTPPAQATQR
ncbi:MAG: DUF4153 domain-containing protein [Gemmatimonadales bacterium]